MVAAIFQNHSVLSTFCNSCCYLSKPQRLVYFLQWLPQSFETIASCLFLQWLPQSFETTASCLLFATVVAIFQNHSILSTFCNGCRNLSKPQRLVYFSQWLPQSFETTARCSPRMRLQLAIYCFIFKENCII